MKGLLLTRPRSRTRKSRVFTPPIWTPDLTSLSPLLPFILEGVRPSFKNQLRVIIFNFVLDVPDLA